MDTPHPHRTRTLLALLAAGSLVAAGPVAQPGAASPQAVAAGDPEGWEPDSLVVQQTADVSLHEGVASADVTAWAVDRENLVIHHSYRGGPAGDRWLLAAFDVRTMSPLGGPLELEGEVVPTVAFFDSSGGRIFVHSESGAVDTYYRWDPDAGQYVTGTTDPVVLASPAALWDPVNQRAVSLERRPVPGDDGEIEWRLRVHTEVDPGTWVVDVYTVSTPLTGGGMDSYASAFDDTASDAAAVLPDGSIVLAGGESPSRDGSAPLLRLVIGAEEAHLTEVPGTALGGPEGAPAPGWSEVHASAAGDLALLDSDRASVLNLRQATDGSLQVVGEPAQVGMTEVAGMAVDPVDGTTWLRGAGSRETAAVRDGELVYQGDHPSLHPDGGRLVVVGDDHALATVTGRGDSPEPGTTPSYGIGRFELVSAPPPATDEAGIEEPTPPSPEADGEPDEVEYRPAADGADETDRAGDDADDVADQGEPGERPDIVSLEGLEPGELVWQLAAPEREVALGTAEDRGDHWYAKGELLPVTVADTRVGGPTWSLAGGLSDSSDGISGEHFGWIPQLVSPGAGATAGAVVPVGPEPGPGLVGPSVLAKAPGGHEPGSATVGAVLELRLPLDLPAGDYTATLTVTALS